MHDPQTLISRLGGIARGTTLQRFGISRARLSHAVRDGEIERLRPGVFATQEAHLCDRQAAEHGGALTCSAALRRHGVWVMTGEGPAHVWVGRRGRSHPHAGCQCISHYFRGASSFGLVDVETALVHLFRCEGEESFFASFESAWQLGMLSGAARRRIRDALPARARWLVDFARPDAESGLESLLRLRMHLLGVHLETQVKIDGVGRVDFVADGRLIIEVDGRQNHDGTVMRHKDLARDAIASALGLETLRFDYAQVVYDWAQVQSSILAALSRLAARA